MEGLAWLLGLALGITCLVVFFVIASNLSGLRKEAERQSRFLRAQLALAHPELTLLGQLGALEEPAWMRNGDRGTIKVEGLRWPCVARGEVRTDTVRIVGILEGTATVLVVEAHSKDAAPAKAA